MDVPVTSITTIETPSWDIIENEDFNRMKRINLIVQNLISGYLHHIYSTPG